MKHGLIVIKDENGPEGLKVGLSELDWVALFLCAFYVLWSSEALFGYNEGAVYREKLIAQVIPAKGQFLEFNRSSKIIDTSHIMSSVHSCKKRKN